MERSNSLEEIRFWEHPPKSGITQTKEKNQEIFKESQSLHQHFYKTHFRMLVKHEMILGLIQEISCTVITLNRESNCTRREENLSQFHHDTST